MNYCLQQTDEFVNVLKNCSEIDDVIQLYLSDKGILILCNHLEFENVKFNKPTYICLLEQDIFRCIETKRYQLDQDLKQQMIHLNGQLRVAAFLLNIRQISAMIKSVNQFISKIEIGLGYVVVRERVVTIVRFELHFQDSVAVIEDQVSLLEDITEMDTIVSYMRNEGNHVNLFQVGKEAIEYFKQRKGNVLEIVMKQNTLELNSQLQNINLELNRLVLQQYNFGQFKLEFPEYNSITIPINVIQMFQTGLKLGLSVRKNDLVCLYFKYRREKEISIVVKSVGKLGKKTDIVLIDDDEEILQELVQEVVRKRVKVDQ